jgi:cytochrome bd-type quinol oxidase subunit 1
MTKAIHVFSVFLAYGAFILIFLAGYDFTGTFTIESITPIILKSLFGAVLFWFLGIIIGDIIVRGIVEDIDESKLDSLEGGFEQLIAEEKSKEKVKVLEKELVAATLKEAITKEKNVKPKN